MHKEQRARGLLARLELNQVATLRRGLMLLRMRCIEMRCDLAQRLESEQILELEIHAALLAQRRSQSDGKDGMTAERKKVGRGAQLLGVEREQLRPDSG